MKKTKKKLTQFAGRGHDAFSLPDHRDDGAGADVGHEIPKKGFGRQVLVVLLRKRARRGEELEGCELEALALEASDDLSDEAALNSVGLDLR